LDDKGWRYREEEFQRSKEQLARFNQELEEATPKPTPRQWIWDALVVVAVGMACGIGTTFILHLL
jgi:hypothetical protein